MLAAWNPWDPRDGYYLLLGIGMLLLTLQPLTEKFRWLNLPAAYLVLGAAMVWLGLPTIDPVAGGIPTKVVEHAAEVIVIVSLAGVGLALDSPLRWSTWRSAARLLMIAMPMTIAFCVGFGVWGLGLAAASAMLLGAALAPTDPVLARSVQVGPPGEDEPTHKFALTAEAGLNDGLAFPFVYFAITMASEPWGTGPIPDWFGGWLGFDVLYRIAVGTLLGAAVGWLLTRLTFSKVGDARTGGENTFLMVLAATFLSYGIVEAVDGYGFIAVFACAAAARRESDEEAEREGEDAATLEKEEPDDGDVVYHPYTRSAHHAAEQIESMLLGLLLLWFGGYLASGVLSGLTWQEVVFAVLLLLGVRPLVGWLALSGLGWESGDRWKVAFFGIRGMGSVFYLAYGQTHANFDDIPELWRVTSLVIALSILLHGFSAGFLMSEKDDNAEP